MIPITLSIAVFASSAAAQSLLEATSKYTQLSNIRQFLEDNPSLLPQQGDVTSVRNILLPSNDAFDKYLATTGTSVQNLPMDIITNVLKYHTLEGNPFEKLSEEVNVLANSELKQDIYNHRNGSDGQVIFVSENTETSDDEIPTAVVASGAGKTVNMSLVDDEWDGGRFQIVDGLLTLPKTCTDTMLDADNGWTTLVSALERTNLTDVLNNFANVTCLAPNNDAFKSAGSPETELPVETLANALKYHTLPGAQYSTGFKDGDEFPTAAGGIVQVTVKANGTIYFNDAQVLKPNVITNNGVIHVLDRIMTERNATKPTTSTSSSPSPTATENSSGTQSPTPTNTATTDGSGKTSELSKLVAVMAFVASSFWMSI
jgi:uncharacterized surface protein with fasciclin (FAS1) repeats